MTALLHADWPLVPAVLIGALTGAIFGSYIATLVLRWPQGKQASSGRSACDGCGHVLGAMELIPIVSWMAQRGQCRHCSAKIDPVHPRTEAAAAVIGGLAFALSPNAGGAALALLCWQLLALALLDARHYWLPHRLSALLAISGLVGGGVMMASLGISASLIDRLIGGAAGFAGLWVIGAVYARARGQQGLGGGDAPMLGAIGLWTGWAALPFILLLASLTGLAVGLVSRNWAADAASGEHWRQQRLPLGTLLAIATPAALLVLRAVSS